MKKNNKAETKASKIINLIIMIVEIIVIILGISLSISVLTGTKDASERLKKGYNLSAVYSDSMDGNVEKSDSIKIPSFKIGDLVVIKMLTQEEKDELKVGDVVTYVGRVKGNDQLITHRIAKIEYKDVGDGTTIKTYYTLGDKQLEGDEEVHYDNDILGTAVSVIPKVGNILIWFQDSTHFLLAVVIPLAALLIYNVYLIIRIVIDYRVKKIKEQNDIAVAAIKAENTIDEEEIKRKAIEEYLAQQKSNDASMESTQTQEVNDEP